jgi:hypothetical protein
MLASRANTGWAVAIAVLLWLSVGVGCRGVLLPSCDSLAKMVCEKGKRHAGCRCVQPRQAPPDALVGGSQDHSRFHPVPTRPVFAPLLTEPTFLPPNQLQPMPKGTAPLENDPPDNTAPLPPLPELIPAPLPEPLPKHSSTLSQLQPSTRKSSPSWVFTASAVPPPPVRPPELVLEKVNPGQDSNRLMRR